MRVFLNALKHSLDVCWKSYLCMTSSNALKTAKQFALGAARSEKKKKKKPNIYEFWNRIRWPFRELWKDIKGYDNVSSGDHDSRTWIAKKIKRPRRVGRNMGVRFRKQINQQRLKWQMDWRVTKRSVKSGPRAKRRCCLLHLNALFILSPDGRSRPELTPIKCKTCFYPWLNLQMKL